MAYFKRTGEIVSIGVPDNGADTPTLFVFERIFSGTALAEVGFMEMFSINSVVVDALRGLGFENVLPAADELDLIVLQLVATTKSPIIKEKYRILDVVLIEN